MGYNICNADNMANGDILRQQQLQSSLLTRKMSTNRTVSCDLHLTFRIFRELSPLNNRFVVYFLCLVAVLFKQITRFSCN